MPIEGSTESAVPLERGVDVLIVTALKLEFDAVLAVSDGFGQGNWLESTNGRYKYLTRSFPRAGGLPPLRVAIARATEMGEVFAAACAVRLLDILNPSVLAMCGVCAGREGAVELGDVVAADRLYKHDTGSAVSTSRDAEEYVVDLLADVRTYNMPLEWRMVLEDFPEDWIKHIRATRPVPIAEQATWISARLAEVGSATLTDVYALKERGSRCANWQEAIDRLHKQGCLLEDWSGLSESGRSRGRRELASFPEGRPCIRSPKLRIGAIATGARLQRDVQLFDRLNSVSRRTLGVEMEGAAIAAVAEIHEVKMIMAKGVMDFADPYKDDTFKDFAAQAASAFLLDFLIRHAPTTQAPPEPTTGPIGAESAATGPDANDPSGSSQEAARSTSRALTRWLLQLRAPLAPGVIEQWLSQTGWAPQSRVKRTKDSSGSYEIMSDASAFARVLRDYRSQKIRAIEHVPVEYLTSTVTDVPGDPIQGKYGYLPRKSGRVLSATISRSLGDWFDCEVLVQSSDNLRPLPPKVKLHVSPSLSPDPWELETPNGIARIAFEIWGSFCIAAEITEEDGSVTQLELNLANVPGVPRKFIDE